MSSQYENREFANAVRAAGVGGRRKDDPRVEAIDECSRAFHNAFQKYERETMSFQEIKSWASEWWSRNYSQYTR